jgi:hypothetical protein
VCLSGIVGDWKNYFTEDMVQLIEECCIRPLSLHQLALPDAKVTVEDSRTKN